MAQVFGRRWSPPWRRRRAAPPAVPPSPPTTEAAAPRAGVATAPPTFLVDSATRTWWKPGAARSETLVETVAPRSADEAMTRRVAALAAGSLPAGVVRLDRVPGTADPAFAELLLVELLRAGRWDRAFAQLAPECQRAWGSPRALAAENAALGRSVAGARVASVGALDRWEDAERGLAWEGVAELVVEYALRTPEGLRPLRRTVHLVDVGGRWRSLLFPPSTTG